MAAVSSYAVDSLVGDAGFSEGSLRIERLGVNGNIEGEIAVTELEIAFSNASEAVFGDEFVMQLGDSQEVGSFEVSIDGALQKSGEPHGYRIDEERRLRIKIEPIRTSETGLIRLSIEQTLESWGSISTYRLALRLDRHVELFDFALTVSNSSRKPRIIQGLPGDLDFENGEAGLELQWSENDVDIDRQIRIDLRQGSSTHWGVKDPGLRFAIGS